MMQVPEHTEVGKVSCDRCGWSMEVTSPPGQMGVGICGCGVAHGSIAPDTYPSVIDR